MKRAGAKGIGAANKKKRAAEREQSAKLFSPAIFEDAAKAKAKAEYGGATPFPHVVLRGACISESLLKTFTAAIQGMQADLKDSDTFKRYEGPALQDIDGAPNLGPVAALRDSLYSPEFRALVSDITGCGALSEKVDCVSGIYNEGCHLLPHDAALPSSRRVAFLVPLFDPEDPFTPEDGGSLELYPPAGQKGGVRTLLPEWNSVVLFEVQRGASVHAISEVLSEDKTVLFLSGWFHAAAPLAGAQADGSPKLVETRLETTLEAFEEALLPLPSLSKEDVAYLSEFVSDTYLDATKAEATRAAFEDASAALLPGFLKPQVAQRLRGLMVAADAKDMVGRGNKAASSAGQGGGWELAGPPQDQRFLVYKGGNKGTSEVGVAMEELRTKLFDSPAYGRLVAALSGVAVTARASSARRFRAGMDYSRATGCAPVPSGEMRLHSTLCLVDEEADEGMDEETKTGLWGSNLSGGYQAFVDVGEDAPSAAEESVMMYQGGKKRASSQGEGGGASSQGVASPQGGASAKGGAAAAAPEEAGEEEDEALADFPARHNSLAIALRDEGASVFVKYLTAVLPGSRWDLAGEAAVAPGDDEEEEDE